MNMEWIVAGLVVMAVTMVVVAAVMVALAWMERRRRRRMVGRLETVSEGTVIAPVVSDLFREGPEREPTALDYVLAATPHYRDLQHLLEQADIEWSAARFYGLTLLAAVGGFLLGYLFTGTVLLAVFPAVLLATFPYLHLLRKRRKRLRAFEEAFAESVDLLGRAIRAGHAFSTGLQTVSEESPDPVATEFRKVFEEQKFGLPIQDSLLGLADRIDVVDVRIFVTAVLIQREVGGNLAEILDNIANTIRERFKLERQVRVHTAQGRMTGYLLAALPIVMGFILYALNPVYMSALWTDGFGRMMLALAGVLQIIGFFVIRRIVDIEY